MPESPPIRTLRHSLRPATTDHERAADLLSEAADAFLAGDIETARLRLRAADLPVLFRFGRLLIDRKDPEVAWPTRLRSAPKPDIPRVKARMPSQIETFALYARDGWRCRYCGCRVIYGRARDVLRKTFSDVIAWPASGPMHGGFFALTATADHIVPHASGGDNSPGNLITACWPCNFGMEHDSLEELGLIDPRIRPPVVDSWDGLTRLVTGARKAFPDPIISKFTGVDNKPSWTASRRSSAKRSNEAAWFNRLDTNQRPHVERFIEQLDSYHDLGVTWSANEVLVARMIVGDHRVQFFALEPDLTVQVPWSTNTPKEHLKLFAELLALGIPNATLRETPKLWNVDVPPNRTVPLGLLLENTKVVRAALEALHSALKKHLPTTP